MESRFASMERLMVGLQERTARVEGILEQMSEKLNHMDARFNWLTGIMITMWVTIIAAILFK